MESTTAERRALEGVLRALAERLILTVLHPEGSHTAETDHDMVEERGMWGALQLLKDEAFAGMPPVNPADCLLRFAFHDAPQAA